MAWNDIKKISTWSDIDWILALADFDIDEKKFVLSGVPSSTVLVKLTNWIRCDLQN